LVFVETSLFTKLLGEYLSDEDYRALQNHLVLLPESGAIIKGSGGVRKIRWRSRGKGKSGGVRVIYYWATAFDQIFLLTLYGKSEKDDLSPTDLRTIVRLLTEMDHG
jgi:mRNA-degrading endonuclease RelE of RelBE toxin-antitoxin system